MLFFGLDVVSFIFSEFFCVLYDLGYIVYVFMYNDVSYWLGNYYWYYVYCLKVQLVEFWKRLVDVMVDYLNGIDDWVGEELLLFVEQFDVEFDFDICVVNYIFLFCVFLGLKEKIKKIFCIYDVFINRNKKFLDWGVINFDFLVICELEVVVLNCVDYVVVLQFEEVDFFSEFV